MKNLMERMLQFIPTKNHVTLIALHYGIPLFLQILDMVCCSLSEPLNRRSSYRNIYERENFKYIVQGLIPLYK